MAKKKSNKNKSLDKPVTKPVTIAEQPYYVGKHAFVDVYWDNHASPLTDTDIIMGSLRVVIEEVGATILHKHVSPFDGGGYTGMFVLSESHASVHTWPEYGMATIDIYMCGDCDAFKALDLLIDVFEQAGFAPRHRVQSKYGRGYTYPNAVSTLRKDR